MTIDQLSKIYIKPVKRKNRYKALKVLFWGILVSMLISNIMLWNRVSQAEIELQQIETELVREYDF